MRLAPRPAIVLYPNRGEAWDASTGEWVQASGPALPARPATATFPQVSQKADDRSCLALDEDGAVAAQVNKHLLRSSSEDMEVVSAELGQSTPALVTPEDRAFVKSLSSIALELCAAGQPCIVGGCCRVGPALIRMLAEACDSGGR